MTFVSKFTSHVIKERGVVIFKSLIVRNKKFDGVTCKGFA